MMNGQVQTITTGHNTKHNWRESGKKKFTEQNYQKPQKSGQTK
jgi:hypothetical protein